MKYSSFEQMSLWKNAIEIARMIFDLTATLPRSEDYGLTSQIRRSAVSISANIAEGYGRETKLDKRRFYTIARGSAFETKSHLLYGNVVGYFSQQQLKDIVYLIELLIHELNKLMKSLTTQP